MEKKQSLDNHINNINAKATNTYPCINWQKKKKNQPLFGLVIGTLLCFNTKTNLTINYWLDNASK